MNSNIKLALLMPMIFGSMNVMAEGSQQHLSTASVHSAQAIGQTAIAGVKIVSAVIAVPLMITGEIGQASGQAGHAFWLMANQPIGEPLAITDEIITSTVSPDKAMEGE